MRLYIIISIVLVIIAIYFYTNDPEFKKIKNIFNKPPNTLPPTPIESTEPTLPPLPSGGVWSKLDCGTTFCTFKPYPFKSINGSYTIEEAKDKASSIGANGFTLYTTSISFFDLKGNNKIASRLDNGNGESYYYEYQDIDPDDCEYSEWVCDCDGFQKRKLTRGSQDFCTTNVEPLVGDKCIPKKEDCDWYYFNGGFLNTDNYSLNNKEKIGDAIFGVSKDFCINKCKENPNCVGSYFFYGRGPTQTECALFDNSMVQHVYDKTKNETFKNRQDRIVYVNRTRMGEDRWNKLNDSTGSYIYSINPNDKSLDCVVGDTWGDWGKCIKGVKTRTKNTISPPKYGGSCNPEKETQPCASDCVVGKWGDYRGCVNDDKKIKTRPTIDPPYNGGTCNERLTETATCDFIEGEWPIYFDNGPVYIDLVSVNENGVRTYSISGEKVYPDISQMRYDPSYNNPDYAVIYIANTYFYTRNGNMLLDENGNAVKIGSYVSRPSPKRPPVDCIKGNWEDWGQCIKGVQTRTKSTVSPPKNDGKCDLEKEERQCDLNCVMGEWKEFSKCVKGKKTTTRSTIAPAYNRGTCNEELVKIEDCDFVEGEWANYFSIGKDYGPVYISLQNIESDGVRNYYISGGTGTIDETNRYLTYNPSTKEFRLPRLSPYNLLGNATLDQNGNAIEIKGGSIGKSLKRQSPI